MHFSKSAWLPTSQSHSVPNEQPGEGDDQIKRTISAIIPDFILIENSSRYHSTFMWRNEEGLVFTEVQQIHTLEIPKLPEHPTSDKASWLKLFKAKESSEMEQVWAI